MFDPFIVEAPAVISFSGGRTSGMMLRRILDAHSGTLPPGAHVLFANTGKEMPETLEFVHEIETRWCVPIVWLEYAEASGTPKRLWRQVDFASASRNGEPFNLLIRKRRTLPMTYGGRRFCTSELKVKTFQRYMKAHGYKRWTNVVGLRYDEPRRVANVTGYNAERGPWETVAPLHASRIVKSDVHAFWKAQPFDLKLEPWESNCDLCFMKSDTVMMKLIRKRPESVQWWTDKEEETGRTFRRYPYAGDLRKVMSSPMLPIFDDEEDSGMPCACTD